MKIALSILVFSLLFTLCGCRRSSPSAEKAAPPITYITDSGAEMIAIPGGAFAMGTMHGQPNEGPPHPVTITAFLMDRFPVTHEQFVKAQLPDPSHWIDVPHTPVEQVRWRDAKEYCNERSKLEHLKPCYNEKTPEWDCDYSADGYRLPTEAEWEYAARAGSDNPYDFGAADQLGQYAWYAANSDSKTHPVGQKKPNAWGLYDMYGNVSQWCEDVYDPGYYARSPSADPTGPPSPGRDVQRVMRGGNWKSDVDGCRATFRRGARTGNTDACFHTDYCGFRCVRRATAEDLAKMKKGG